MTSPWMHSVVLATANTAYSLYELLAAFWGAGSPQPPKWQSINAQFCAIQVDPNSSGDDVQVAVGNSDVALNNCGVVLFPGQTFPIYSMESSLINFKDIWVMANANGIQLNISFIQR